MDSSQGLGAIEPPSSLDLDSYNVPVHLIRATANSLAERFRIPKNIRTTAALWLDDDILISPEDVEFGFRAWQAFGKEKHRIVGFSGRRHRFEDDMYYYIFDQHMYSMVLTSSAFLDLTMMDWFWADNASTKAAIAYVNQHLNCEDILMNCKIPTLRSLAVLRLHRNAESPYFQM